MENENANIQDLLDELFDLFDKSWVMPLSGGKSFVDASEARQILEEIKDALPDEMRKAKVILMDRDQIISGAQKEAEAVMRSAEVTANEMIEKQEIMRQAQARAEGMLSQADAECANMRQATRNFVEGIMKDVDDSLASNLDEVRRARQKFMATQ